MTASELGFIEMTTVASNVLTYVRCKDIKIIQRVDGETYVFLGGVKDNSGKTYLTVVETPEEIFEKFV